MHRRSFLAAGAASAATLLTGRAGGVASAAPELPLPLVPARMAESLCESFMLNTKIFYNTTVYKHTDAVVDLLKELGVRTVRERIGVGTSRGVDNQKRAMLRLSAAGTKWHGTVADIDDWQNPGPPTKATLDVLTDYYRPRLGGNLSALMRSFGGVNEIDHPNHGPDWPQHARIMQTALWNQAKARPETAQIPVAGPSTRSDFTVERARMLGDLSAISDLGAVHYYNKGTSPTRGITERIDISRRNFPDARRWVVCETGYNNSPQTNGNVTVPEWASARYAIRGICDFAKLNAVYGRFELLDDPDHIDTSTQTKINSTADIQAHFGLVAMTKPTIAESTPDTWRKKPEFYAAKRFLALFSDRGSAFTPNAIPLRITGGGSDLRSLVLQKRDGRHYVALWRDVVVAEPYPRAREVNVDADSITVQFAPARPVAVYAPNRGTTPLATRAITDTITLAVSGELRVVEIG